MLQDRLPRQVGQASLFALDVVRKAELLQTSSRPGRDETRPFFPLRGSSSRSPSPQAVGSQRAAVEHPAPNRCRWYDSAGSLQAAYRKSETQRRSPTHSRRSPRPSQRPLVACGRGSFKREFDRRLQRILRMAVGAHGFRANICSGQLSPNCGVVRRYRSTSL